MNNLGFSLIVALAAATLLVAVFIIYSIHTKRTEETKEGFEQTPTAQYLSLIHVEPVTVTLALDAFRGPQMALDGNAKSPQSPYSSLSNLSKIHGLYLFEANGPTEVGLCVNDVAMLAAAADKRDEKTPMLVGPLSPLPEARRAFFLLSPLDPTKGYPPSLGQLIRDEVDIHVYCPSGIESSLFALAWAIAGGGDLEEHPRVVVEVMATGYSKSPSFVSPQRATLAGRAPLQPEFAPAARAALAASRKDAFSPFVIVPVWACTDSLAFRNVLSSWPQAYASSISYHPSDSSLTGDDGFLTAAAPQVLHARAPSLTTAPVRVMQGVRPNAGIKDSMTQTVMVAPSLVVLYPPRSEPENEEATLLMADAISDALLKDKDLSNTKRDPETSIALCTFYEAQGLPLLPRTSETVRAFDEKRQRVAFDNPYSRPSIPILEQYRDFDRFDKQRWTERNFSRLKHKGEWGKEGEEDDGPPVEIVPKRHVRLSITNVHPDAPDAIIGGGYVEATLEPEGTISVDGVRLRTGDRLILERQGEGYSDQNGTWVVVTTFGESGIPILQNPVALNPRKYYTKIERASRNSTLIEPGWQWRFTVPVWQEKREHVHIYDDDTVEVLNGLTPPTASLLREGDRVAWLPLPGAPTGTVAAVGKPTAVTSGLPIYDVIEVIVPAGSVTASPEAVAFEAEWFDPLSRCLDSDAIGHTLDTRQVCLQKYGEDSHQFRWDRPCRKDTECRYLEKGIEHSRGACLPSGRCEMPAGVKSFAYRQVDADEGLVCPCPSPHPLSLQKASKACCELPGSSPMFPAFPP